MNGADILLILLLAAALVWAAVRCVKTRRRGGCGCGCAGCTAGTCTNAPRRDKTTPPDNQNTTEDSI
ncbi:MAG: FeoB-associated Cys-rich membrane protein [Ruminococcaceae bacterium]|nr:FeoB-associated Cys-rich membrane protein [Oscillospiraceae bacterium]